MAFPWSQQRKRQAVAPLSGAAPVARVPYHSDLNTPMLRIGKDTLRLLDFYEAFAIFGAPGSGKTSASFFAWLLACCAAGMGGIYCVYKTSAIQEIEKAAALTGRTGDLVYLSRERINLLDYIMEHLGGREFVQNLVAFTEHMMDATRRVSGTNSGADSGNRYFTDGALKFAFHAFPLLMAAYGTIRLADLYAFITSVPMSAADVLSDAWQSSFCCQTHLRVIARAKAAQAAGKPDARLERVIAEHGDFYLNEVANLDAKPKTSILSTLTNSLYPFLAGKLKDTFATDTTILPNACRQGQIIVLDFPIDTGAGGIVSQILMKYICGLAWQSEQIHPNTRGVFIAADEAQFYLAASDSDLLSTSRSAKIAVCYATQDLPTYYAKVGSNARDVAESILSKFGTRIYHANLSRETNNAAAEQIGKVEKFHVTESRSRGNTSGTGGSLHDRSGGFHGNFGGNTGTSQSTSGYIDYDLPPDYFSTSLRSGGKANRYKVDAIIVRNAKNFAATKRHWVKAEFTQQRTRRGRWGAP